MDPQQRRQKTLEALTAQVEALSRQNPLLMIFEDAHWTDPTSLETFGRVVDRVRAGRGAKKSVIWRWVLSGLRSSVTRPKGHRPKQ